MSKPRLVVFASGSRDGGGSGFEVLVQNTRTGILEAEIVGIISNHLNGGVRKRAERLNIPFAHFSGPYITEEYQAIIEGYQADWVSLSGWLKEVHGLDPRHTINIHPGPLPEFGGHGMYGHYVHEAVLAAYHRGEIDCSAVSMHFVTEKYDKGPVFFKYPVYIDPQDTPGTLAERVNKIEHGWQSWVTNLVIQKKIALTGKGQYLLIPPWYPFLPKNN